MKRLIHSYHVCLPIIETNQRLQSAGDNNQRSKCFCSDAVLCTSFTMVDGQNMRDQITSDRRAKNASDQIAFCAFHSFLVEVQMNTGYMHATHA